MIFQTKLGTLTGSPTDMALFFKELEDIDMIRGLQKATDSYKEIEPTPPPVAIATDDLRTGDVKSESASTTHWGSVFKRR